MVQSRILACAGIGMCLLISASHAVDPMIKFKDWLPVGPGETSNPRVDGMAMLRVRADPPMTSLQMVMHFLEPNTQYGVQVTRDGLCGQTMPQAFTTTSRGKGVFDTEFSEGGETGAPALIIFIWDPVNNPDPGADVVTVGEQRAFSIPTP